MTTPNAGIPEVPENTLDPAAGLNDAIRVSDVILGEGRGNAFAPAARVSLSAPTTVRLVVRDQTSTFDDVRVKATLTRAGDDTAAKRHVEGRVDEDAAAAGETASDHIVCCAGLG